MATLTRRQKRLIEESVGRLCVSVALEYGINHLLCPSIFVTQNCVQVKGRGKLPMGVYSMTRNRISLNPRYFDTYPFDELLDTVAHEIAHWLQVRITTYKNTYCNSMPEHRQTPKIKRRMKKHEELTKSVYAHIRPTGCGQEIYDVFCEFRKDN